MKNTKRSSIILAIITIVSLILDTVSLEPFGIDVETVSKISGVLTIIKLIYDNRGLFNESEMTDFGNFVLRKDSQKREAFKGSVTHADFENWKEENRS